jgi:polyphosphate kinase
MNVTIINRDISWLSFNARVLQEAADKTLPLIERIKFLGIFSNNLDEFFRVRVGTYKRMINIGKNAKYYIGENPAKVLQKIQSIVVTHQKEFDRIYEEILLELKKKNIFIVDENSISKNQGEFVKNYFKEMVRPLLVPIMIQHTNKLPYLRDKSIYLAVKLSHKIKNKDSRYALIQVPDDLPRFVQLPASDKKDGTFIILLDDVIRYCLEDIFFVFNYDTYGAYTIKLTRDAELDIDSDLSKSITEKISKSLKQRKIGEPVRLVYDSQIPKDMLDFLTKSMKIDKNQALLPGGRYHNFKDFIQFPKVGGTELVNVPLPTLEHPKLKGNKSMFEVLKKGDILLTFPYQSFDHIIDFLREAAIDPAVTSIKITLYRAAKNSKIINALVNALQNGKAVTAVVELQARFDEQANLNLANKLQDEGATLIYGVPGLKVHSKIIYISRKEGAKTVTYAHIGTGNFNESTAKVYSDFSLFTSDQRITSEVEKVFHFFKNNYKTGAYKNLLVAPFFMRNKLLKLIQNEIKNAKANKPALIQLKLNSLTDEELIKKLYSASNAGVKIQLIIRGICSLVPGVKGMSEHIEAISLVDTYLEHARSMLFHNNGDELVYISSADWMIRNLDFRTEVACPVYDVALKNEIKKIFEIQWNGSTKVRLLNEKQDNPYRQAPDGIKRRAQLEIYKYLASKK